MTIQKPTSRQTKARDKQRAYELPKTNGGGSKAKGCANFAPLTPKLMLQLAAPHTWPASIFPFWLPWRLPFPQVAQGAADISAG